MGKKLIVVVANQRSGTTALHRSLSQTGGITEFGEIFHSGAHEINKKSNYFYYKKNILHIDYRINNENEEDSYKLCSEYIDYLLSLSDKEYILIDIKYNSWHHFNSAWQDVFNKPILLKVLENKNTIFIHMVRMNIFAQFVSMEVANRTGKWHYSNNDNTKVEDITIDLNPKKALKFMENSNSNTHLFRTFLRNNQNKIELVYEYTYDKNGITKYAIGKLEKYIDNEILNRIHVPLKKTPRKLKDIVNNKEELLEFFSNKKFENLVGITLFQ